MTADIQNSTGIARYAPLGLIANPFKIPRDSSAPITDLEVASKSNELLKAIIERSKQDAPKPLWVDKGADIPEYYFMAALAGAEAAMATDDDINILYALVELFTMRDGVTRSTLRILAERLSFRSFDRTLVPFIETILANPDTELPSYQMVGPEQLEVFASHFRTDPLEAIHTYLGTMEEERRPEFTDAVDYRPLSFDEDVADESDTTAEIDATVTDAPGTGAMLAEAEVEPPASDEDVAGVRDYIIEYTSTHVSSVIARALRVFHDRGLIMMAQEFRVTKAPRKTLAALTRFARGRYRKVAVLFDGFEQWLQIDQDLRSKLAGTMSEMRWKLAGDAMMVFFVEQGTAPELEETFRGNDILDWSYAELGPLQERGDTFDADTVERWLRLASLNEAEPLSMSNAVLAALADKSGGSFMRFVTMAGAAVEDAAERGIATLDDKSLQAGLAQETAE